MSVTTTVRCTQDRWLAPCYLLWQILIMFNDATQTRIRSSNLTNIGGNQINNTYITVGHSRGIVYDLHDGRLHYLPLEQVDINVFIVDGDVALVNMNSCWLLTFYNSLCMCIAKTDFHQFLWLCDWSCQIRLSHSSTHSGVCIRNAVCRWPCDHWRLEGKIWSCPWI